VKSSCTKERGKIAVLGYFRKVLKAAISFVMEQLRSHSTDFLEILSMYFEKSGENSSLIKVL
jgi:hypothetical protein